MKEKCSVEVFSRVTGFFRPVQSWNKGKTEEFGDRNTFNPGVAMDKVSTGEKAGSCSS